MSYPSSTAYPSLSTPTSGLGSASRIVGANFFGGSRTKIGSAIRIYNSLKNTYGTEYTLLYLQRSIYGPFVIRNNRLVWN